MKIGKYFRYSEALWVRLLIYTTVMFVSMFCMGYFSFNHGEEFGLINEYGFLRFDAEAGLMIGGAAASGFLIFFAIIFWKDRGFKAVEAQGFEPVFASLLPLILVTMIMVPGVWYLSTFGESEEYRYMRDVAYTSIVGIPFTLMAFEGRNYRERIDGCQSHWLPYALITFISLACMFGFPAIKYFCKWLMLYSGEYFLVTMALVLSLIILPLGLGIGLLFLSALLVDD